MTIDEFTRLLQAQKQAVEKLIRRELPVKVGRMAKDHFQDNFRRQGFVNGGLTPWPKTKRQLSGSDSAAAQYGALLSGRNHLFSSIIYTPGDGRVKISNGLQYAPLHNDGGWTAPTVTPAMRGHAWKMYYLKGGGQKGKPDPAEADKWKALALTRKKQLHIHIPKRQFLGPSQELTQKINKQINDELEKILLK